LFAEARLRDGTEALIWELLPSDREALRQGYEQLSVPARHHRFLAAVPHLTDAMLDVLVGEVDGIDHVALVLVVLDENHDGEPVGVARMVRYPEQPDAADVAVTVLDQWQGRGVATALLEELVRRRPEGVTRLVTVVAADNPASVAMLRRLGRTTVTLAGSGLLDVEVDLPETPRPAGRPD
jgi:RimJ/RimL family protein N-acetyltransferase